MIKFLLLSIALLGVRFGLVAAPTPRAALLSDPHLIQNEALIDVIAGQVAAAGYAAERITVNQLADPAQLTRNRFELLVLCEAESLPAKAAPAIENFLKQGGDLLALGLPAWKNPQFQINDRWISRADYERTLAEQRPTHWLFNFETDNLDAWRRTADNPNNPAHYEIVDVGGTKALHASIGKFTGWDTFQSPTRQQPFPAGHSLTCFRAKGSAHTKQLALEWTERDGSRWIATVNLTDEWKQYALPPEAFEAWRPPGEHVGTNDQLRVEKVARLVVGLAYSHTALESGAQAYWIADIGTAANPFGAATLPDNFEPPHLESLAPTYQCFPINHDSDHTIQLEWLTANPSDSTAPAASVKLPVAPDSTWLGLHPRPRGVGFNQERAYRWAPLLAVRDADTHDYRGAMAALLIHSQAPYRGSVWAAFTPAELEFYQQPLVRDCLRQTLTRMRRGLFLTEGGAEFFTVFPDQTVPIGLRAVNFGHTTPTNLTLRLSTREASNPSQELTISGSPVLAPDQTAQLSQPWQPESWPRNGWQVVSELLVDGQVVDRLEHSLHVWRPAAHPQFMVASNGGFWLGNQPWKAHGVNYMPSSGLGLANWRHFEHWVGRGAYDPEVIQRDLERVKGMNLNAVSVFIYHQSLDAQHLLDFLRRCEALGLKVNLSLRPGTPLDFRWDEMREMIQTLRLAQNDTVFAYDLAWEPSHGPHDAQVRAYLSNWNEWIQQHYASRRDLVAAWGESIVAQLTNATPANVPWAIPPIHWITQDGPWRRCIADYRQFLDAKVAAAYAEARRLVQSVDPHHSVSFRMQHAGDPTFNWDGFIPYDFYGLRDAVDLWEPEAYGRIGDWEKVKPGRFTADYARLCDPDKPIFWSEMGYSVWDRQLMQPGVTQQNFQAQYFSDFYRLLDASDVDGIFYWWYPGGYRLNEQSDYGIINPDGTDRPVTQVIRKRGAEFLARPKQTAPPDYWISVNRDRDARGLFGIYEAVQADYWKAIAAGKRPGLRWSHPPGAATETSR